MPEETEQPGGPEKLTAGNLTVHFAGLECDVYKTIYQNGGATALFLDDARDRSPVATATVNVPEANHILDSGTALIKDYSECEGMMDALESAGIVRDTGETIPIGFTYAKVARLLV
jgi:hypothetical protein